MRILIITFVLLLSGCEEFEDRICGNFGYYNCFDLPHENISFTEVFPDIIHRTNGNGWINVDVNEVTYTSHNPEFDQTCTTHNCKKVDSRFDATPWTPNRTTKYEFDLRINKYNQYQAPDWIILFQDWNRIDVNDLNGNHPTTTLKIKQMSNGRFKLAHFENSWQFNYSTTNPIDPNDPYDFEHNHPPNREHGSKVFDSSDILEWQHIEIIIHDGIIIDEGYVTVKINDRVVSHAAYRTKNTANTHKTQFGMYWSKEYNLNFNKCGHYLPNELECKSNSITIRDFRVFESYE